MKGCEISKEIISYITNLLLKKFGQWLWAQLAERSLPTLEDQGLDAIFEDNLFTVKCILLAIKTFYATKDQT